MKMESNPEEATYQYDVFLSYSHKDKQLANRLSQRIRRYKAPKKTGLDQRKLEIFRDEERLTASKDLRGELEKNVSLSRKFVLLVSPDSGNSPYVEEEVSWFFKNRSIEDTFLVLTRGNIPGDLPECFQKAIEEPLHINMLSPDKKKFRLESLRLIAALLGISYDRLRLEDESYRRGRRNRIIVFVLSILFILGSFFLIYTKPAEGWVEVELPYVYDPLLMPVHDIAVSKMDPTVVLYYGKNAKWVSNPIPKGYLWNPDWHHNSWEVTREYLAGPASPEFLPVAKLEFKTEDTRNSMPAELTIFFFRIFDFDINKTRFLRSMQVDAFPVDKDAIHVKLPPTFVKSNNYPLELYPWPYDTLNSLGLADIFSYNSHKATLTNLQIEKKIDLEFTLRDADDGYWEWVVEFGPQDLFFSKNEPEQIIIGGDTLVNLEHDESLWHEIIKDPNWLVASSSTRTSLGDISYPKNVNEINKVLEKIPDIQNLGTLSNQIKSALTGEFNTIALISNKDSTIQNQIIEITGYVESIELDDEPLPIWFFRSSPTSWLQIFFPESDEDKLLRVIDIHAIDNSGQSFLISTNNKGLFRTINAGKTWESINLGIADFQNGAELKIIPTGSKPPVYILVDKHDEFKEGANPLFYFHRKNWTERWRMGLSELLKLKNE